MVPALTSPPMSPPRRRDLLSTTWPKLPAKTRPRDDERENGGDAARFTLLAS